MYEDGQLRFKFTSVLKDILTDIPPLSIFYTFDTAAPVTPRRHLHHLTGTAGQLFYILGERLRTELESFNHGQIGEQVIADFLNGQTCS